MEVFIQVLPFDDMTTQILSSLSLTNLYKYTQQISLDLNFKLDEQTKLG